MRGRSWGAVRGTAGGTWPAGSTQTRSCPVSSQESQSRASGSAAGVGSRMATGTPGLQTARLSPRERTQNRTHQGTGRGITSDASPVRFMKPGQPDPHRRAQNQPRRQREAQPWKHLLRRPAQPDHPSAPSSPLRPDKASLNHPPKFLAVAMAASHPGASYAPTPALAYLEPGPQGECRREITDRNRGEYFAILQHSHDIPRNRRFKQILERDRQGSFVFLLML